MADTLAMLRKVALLLLVLSPFVAAAEEPAGAVKCEEVPVDPRPVCVDAVVLASFREYRPRPMGPTAEDEVVMSWTWDVDIRVREVYLGDLRPGRLTIGATLHAQFDRELKQPVLFLTRGQGQWYLAYIEFAARDASGKLVVPVFDAPPEGYLSPTGWIPHDYAKWLKPVSYRASDVVPFEETYEDQPRSEDEWLRFNKDRQIAKRGFRLEDIPAMLEERRAVECAREKPGGETARS